MIAVRAVTDCEVVIVGAAAASDITSRHAELAAAFNRLRTIRARRVDRLLSARARLAAATVFSGGARHERRDRLMSIDDTAFAAEMQRACRHAAVLATTAPASTADHRDTRRCLARRRRAVRCAELHRCRRPAAQRHPGPAPERGTVARSECRTRGQRVARPCRGDVVRSRHRRCSGRFRARIRRSRRRRTRSRAGCRARPLLRRTSGRPRSTNSPSARSVSIRCFRAPPRVDGSSTTTPCRPRSPTEPAHRRPMTSTATTSRWPPTTGI